MADARMPVPAVDTPRGAPAGPECPQHGGKFLSREDGFGGWEAVTCTKCHRLIARRKKDE